MPDLLTCDLNSLGVDVFERVCLHLDSLEDVIITQNTKIEDLSKINEDSQKKYYKLLLELGETKEKFEALKRKEIVDDIGNEDKNLSTVSSVEYDINNKNCEQDDYKKLEQEVVETKKKNTMMKMICKDIRADIDALYMDIKNGI